MGWEICKYIGPSDKAMYYIPFSKSTFSLSVCILCRIYHPEYTLKKDTFFQITFPLRRCLIENIFFSGSLPLSDQFLSLQGLQYVPFKAGFEIDGG